MKLPWLALFLLFAFGATAQGSISGVVADGDEKLLTGATVQLSFGDSLPSASVLSEADGSFRFDNLKDGWYKLRISFLTLQTLVVDSILVKTAAPHLNLGLLTLATASGSALQAVVVYAEKPLFESKDGNVTFNTANAPQAAGSSAAELVTQVPLVTRDADGKILVRGREPRILIDDKPVSLNVRQLQDLLESMPGSTVEKIEVLTNPPPQHANEQGGVINIVTKKGAVGMGGRVMLSYGTRGESSANASANYRTQGLALNISAGMAQHLTNGWGYSIRQNQFRDSSNRLLTRNNFENNGLRPHLRFNVDIDLSKFHALNIVLNANGNRFDNDNHTRFENENRYSQVYKGSDRYINSDGNNANRNISLNYQIKTRRAGETIKINTGFGGGTQENLRHFYQQYLGVDLKPNGVDSTQLQENDQQGRNYHATINYDRPFKGRKTFVHASGGVQGSRAAVDADVHFRQKSDGSLVRSDLLSNAFTFYQHVSHGRVSLKQVFKEGFSATAGLGAEHTHISFQLEKSPDTANQYLNLLPFASITRNWKNVLNASLNYKKSIRRPGMQELNPTIDFADPFNIRYGNPTLMASTSHNFDLVLGRTKPGYFLNLGLGYNLVEAIFSPIRSLQPDGKTHVTWQNISGKKEYELSTWNGYTFSKSLKMNLSASITWNEYSRYDVEVRKFRNGISFTSNVGGNYNIKDVYSASGSINLNRFANPQGTVRSNISMNFGVQGKFFNKKLTVALNAIDPLLQQENRVYTYAPNFALENFNTTRTRNYRLSLSYNFTKAVAKKQAPAKKTPAKKAS